MNISDSFSATVFWFAIFAGFGGFIWVNGEDFIDKPQLLSPATPLNYLKTQKSQQKDNQYDGQISNP
jgi:hypothetical protein